MKMFKLLPLSIGYFAIVKVYTEGSVFPLNVHGVIRVIYADMKYHSILAKGMSKELLESDEIEFLKREAIEQTQEEVADEFPD